MQTVAAFTNPQRIGGVASFVKAKQYDALVSSSTIMALIVELT